MYHLLHTLIGLYTLIVLIYAAIEWCFTFKVIKGDNEGLKNFSAMLGKVTEPLLTPLRKALPKTEDFDYSPIVLVVVLWIIRSMIWSPGYYGGWAYY